MNKTKITEATVSFISDPTMNKINVILLSTDEKTLIEASGYLSKVPGTLKDGKNPYIYIYIFYLNLISMQLQFIK
jgi:hypothetical protein